MKISISTIFTFIAGVICASVAPIVASAQASATIAAVSPESAHDFVGGGAEYLNDIEVIFADAVSVSVDDGLSPMFALVSSTSTFPMSASQINPSYLIESISTTVEGTNGHISVVGKSPYGGQLGLSPAATNNQLAVKLPAGLFLVTGSDGVTRPSPETFLRYTFDNIHRINPVGIDDGASLTPAELDRLTFADGISLYAPTGKTGYQVWDFPSGMGGMRRVVGRYTLSMGDDGCIHAEYEGNYTRNGNTTEYTGTIAELPEGQYYLVPSTQMMFKNAEGQYQKSAWMTPITLVKPVATQMRIGVAGDIGATTYAGADMPVFAVEPSGEISFNPGYTVSATVDGAAYALEQRDGMLAFSADDNMSLVLAHLNGPAFGVTVVVPAGALSITMDDGARLSNSEQLVCMVDVTIDRRLDIADLCGDYYVKYVRGFRDNRSFEDGGSSVTVTSDDDGQIAITGLFDPASAVLATVDVTGRRLIIPLQRVTYNGESCYLASFDGGDIVADVGLDGRIVMSDWGLISPELHTHILLAVEMLIVRDDGAEPETPAFEAYVAAEAGGGYAVKGRVVCCSSAVGAIEVYSGDSLVYIDRDAEAGQTLDFVIDAAPVKGTRYVYTAVATKGARRSGRSAEVVVTYNPLEASDVEGDYYITDFKGIAANYYEYGVVMADEAGDFDYSGIDMHMYIDGTPVGGKCKIYLGEVYGTFAPAGTLDMVTGALLFNVANAYSISYEVINPETGKPEPATTAFMLIDDSNTSGDVTRNHRLVATLDTDGVLTFGAWQLVEAGELYNRVFARGEGLTAVRNRHIAAADPVITAEIAGNDTDGDSCVVTVRVVLPEAYADGAPLPARGGGHSLTVRRVGADGLSTVAYEANNADCGQVFEFVDKVAPGEYTYTAVDTYLGAVGATVSAGVEIASVVDILAADSAAVDVYDLRGVMVASAATAADIANLPRGIYIIGMRKVVKW